MELDRNWLTEGLIDFEYKKYVLLAYLNSVRRSFNRVELYPFLSDMIAHYQNLLAVNEGSSRIKQAFPKEIDSENLQKLRVTYRTMTDDDDTMKEIKSIVDFALPHFKSLLADGTALYDYVESHCTIEPIGITLLSKEEGYLFISQSTDVTTKVYRYHTTIFNTTSQFKGIHVKYLIQERRTIVNTCENIKLKLIKKFKDLPTPSVYHISSRVEVPFLSTLVPISKRLLIRNISLD